MVADLDLFCWLHEKCADSGIKFGDEEVPVPFQKPIVMGFHRNFWIVWIMSMGCQDAKIGGKGSVMKDRWICSIVILGNLHMVWPKEFLNIQLHTLLVVHIPCYLQLKWHHFVSAMCLKMSTLLYRIGWSRYRFIPWFFTDFGSQRRSTVRSTHPQTAVVRKCHNFLYSYQVQLFIESHWFNSHLYYWSG